MEGFLAGRRVLLEEPQAGSLATLPELPPGTEAGATAHYIRRVLTGQADIPAPIARQVALILQLADQL
jgi:anthranilate phosphoribosyltransferase